MKHAHVENNLVMRIMHFEGAIHGKFGPEMVPKIILCDDVVEVGWHFDGTDFTPPTAQEVAKQESADLHEARLTAVIDQFDKLLDVLEAKGSITQADVDLIRQTGI